MDPHGGKIFSNRNNFCFTSTALKIMWDEFHHGCFHSAHCSTASSATSDLPNKSYAIVTWSPPTTKFCLLLTWGEQWLFYHGQQSIPRWLPQSSSRQTGKTQTSDGLFHGQENSNRSGEQCFYSGWQPATSGILPGIDNVLHTVQHLPRWSGWQDWECSHQVFWWHKAGCWGGHTRGKRSDREAWKGWRSGLGRAVWSLTKTGADSCPWDDTTKEPFTGWALCGWGAALLKGPRVDERLNTLTMKLLQ